jgi:chitinase
MKSHYLSVLLVVIFAVLQSCTFSTKKEVSKKTIVKTTKSYKVVAYVAGYRNFDFTTIDVSGITHINYAFANINNGEVIFDTTKIDGKSLTPKDIEALNSLKSKNPDLKVLVSVGGWSWSKGFSDAALTEESRLKFAKSCAVFVDKYSLDGIDLDWEYPNQIGAGNTYRPEDVHNFTLMLKAVREQLDLLAKNEATKKHYLLTLRPVPIKLMLKIPSWERFINTSTS